MRQARRTKPARPARLALLRTPAGSRFFLDGRELAPGDPLEVHHPLYGWLAGVVWFPGSRAELPALMVAQDAARFYAAHFPHYAPCRWPS